jgi:hypothetical protein
MNPALFIGSSSEGLDLARAVRSALAADAEVTLWNEGVFALGFTFIESLVDALARFDFAVLLFSPDDLTVSRDAEAFGPRDNVLFELGLFMGRLGRTRTFVMRPRAAGIKIPSDLAGLNTAAYDWPRADGNHLAAVGEACDKIRSMIRSLGPAESKVSARIDAVQQEQVRQRADFEAIVTFLLQNLVTQYELVHLRKLAAGEPFPFSPSAAFEAELRRLLGLGLLRRIPGHGIRSLFQARDDVRFHLEITDRGRAYLEHLRQTNAQDAHDAEP